MGCISICRNGLHQKVLVQVYRHFSWCRKWHSLLLKPPFLTIACSAERVSIYSSSCRMTCCQDLKCCLEASLADGKSPRYDAAVNINALFIDCKCAEWIATSSGYTWSISIHWRAWETHAEMVDQSSIVDFIRTVLLGVRWTFIDL